MNYLENPESNSMVLEWTAARAALNFNAMHRTGTLVRYWAEEKVGDPTGTAKTATAAYVFGDIVAAVCLEGVANVIPLENLEVIS